MFKILKKPGIIKKTFSYFVFGSICIIFIFIGVPVSQMSNMGGIALIVNNKVVSLKEYRGYLDTLKQQSKSTNANNQVAKRQKQQVIDNLIRRELITQEANNIHFTVAQKAVQNNIVKIPLFQQDGRFIHSRYRAFLKSRQFTASYFENLIKKEIQIENFQNMFNMTVHLSKQETQQQKKLESVAIKVSYKEFASHKLTPEQLNDITKAVASKDVTVFFKKQKWQWKHIKSFNLNRTSLPTLKEHKVLFNAVINKIPETGIINFILKVRNKSFILRVDSISHDNKKTQNMVPALAGVSFQDTMASTVMFFSWIRMRRASAKLQFNPKLLQ